MPKLIAAVALVAAATFAQPLRAERTLYWSSIDVDARLDASGRLHVRETQHYVFDGAWNGGERIFRLGPGQKIEVRSVARVEGGREKRLTRGNLDRVDHYDWTGGRLRWRSRMPDDPPFRNEPITYVLDYTYSNIVIPRAGGYLLDHAFLFADRAGRIERFTLDLRLDEPWKGEARTFHRELDDVPSGQNAVLRIPLEYAAAGAPAYVRPRALAPASQAPLRDPRPFHRGLIAAVVLAAAIAWLLFARNEKSVGRFDPLPSVGRRWLEENLLPIRAETIGAAWDREVKQAEVAALLARLVAEGKIESGTIASDGEPELHMTLKVPHESFSGYERELIDTLFFDGMETDTASIREHYRSSGLDPAALIRPGIVVEVEKLSGEPAEEGRAGKALAVLVVVFLAIALWRSPADDRIWAIGGAAMLAATLAGAWFLAMRWQRRPDLGRADSFWLLVPWVMSIAVLAWLFGFRLPSIVELGFALSAISGMAASATIAHSTETAAGVAFRRKLAAVRNFFKAQLRRAEPSLEDAWFPYVLAFGLAKEAEMWFRAFGGTSSERSSMRRWSHGGSSSSPGGAAGWTGGGGAFGGGGASGTWIAAASGMAAGIAAPSSSGGGGGGFSGGGGSSGGGGGGGW